MDRDGPRFLIVNQLKSYFRLPGAGTWHRGLIDTGASVTVLTESVWRKHARSIEWVSAPNGEELPVWLQWVAGIGGGMFKCNVGLVEVSFFDSQLRCLQPRRIFVKYPLDGGGIPHSLIGLGGCTLEERRLEIEYSSNTAWLHEVVPTGL